MRINVTTPLLHCTSAALAVRPRRYSSARRNVEGVGNERAGRVNADGNVVPPDAGARESDTRAEIPMQLNFAASFPPPPQHIQHIAISWLVTIFTSFHLLTRALSRRIVKQKQVLAKALLLQRTPLNVSVLNPTLRNSLTQ